MHRSVIGLCAGAGMFVGGYVPALWGGSAFSASSLLLSVVGGIVGIWAGVRVSDL